MKASNRSSIITGAILLVLAAFFSISLIIQPLDFGISGPGHNNILYTLGRMLYAVYGFSSILIPVFLLIAGISCFATKWTSKKTMRLITALVPFFTAVLTEKICRASLNLGNPNSTAVKISIAIVTGVMLIGIEIIGAGIIAESVNQRIFYRNKKPKSKPVTQDLNLSFDEESQNQEETLPPEPKDEAKQKKLFSIFDKALTKIKSNPEKENNFEEDDFQNQVHSETDDEIVEESAFEDIDLNKIEENASIPETKAETVTSENTVLQSDDSTKLENSSVDSELDNPYFTDDEEPTEPAEPVKENPPQENKDENQEEIERPIENPASIISQEEYAALIQSDLPPEEDELEWPNLPPQPATLPPEYIEDFDEDDPSLEFPPKEENPIEESEQNDDDESVESENDEPTYDEAENITESPAAIEPTEDFEQYDESVESENDEQTAAESEISENPAPQRKPLKYSDAITENPAFPFGIRLHPEDENPEPEAEIQKPAPERKYPVKISFEQNDEEESIEPEFEDEDSYSEPAYAHNSHTTGQNVNRIPMEQVYEQKSDLDDDYDQNDDDIVISDVKDDYEEDITLPEPDYDNMHERAFIDGTPDKNEGELDSDFFDIDLNAAPEEQELSDDLDDEDYDDDDVAAAIFEQIAVQESPKPVSINSAAKKVFSDMEEDIRKEQPQPEAHVETQEKAQTETKTESHVELPFGLQPQNNAHTTLNPNAQNATNLTADELTDFFNAQQEQNMPQTQEITGNLPKTNQATKKGPYVIPSDLLTAYKDDQYWIIDEETKQASINLKQTLSEFNIEADIIGIKKGPVVTMFELLPAPGVKLSKIVTLQDNIALSLAAQSVRIVAPIPGKQAVGIEVPNRNRSVVGFREIIEMNLPEWNKMAVPVVLGKDILGKAQLIDLVKTPHMLIAGATGSGKSVCVNSLILSILYKRSYKDVKLILVDPKVVELKLYNNIPHLLTPVITEPKKALQALQYCLCEMERRYALLDGLGVRDISNYNQRIKERNICTEKLPYIVVIIDEFADLMATSGKELESIVARLTAMSRAVGIHLVLATQRPSVNVITGLIKANIPTRIAFMVASRTDSNIIIDSTGAEKLLGRGDMLYASAVDPYPVRIQGTFVTDQEVEDVVNYVKQYGEPDYIDDEIFVDDDDEVNEDVDLFGNAIGEDPLYDQALEIVVQAGKASASYIQRRLKIGYNRAARLVEEMEERGIVGPANGSKPREVIHIP